MSQFFEPLKFEKLGKILTKILWLVEVKNLIGLYLYDVCVFVWEIFPQAEVFTQTTLAWLACDSIS